MFTRLSDGALAVLVKTGRLTGIDRVATARRIVDGFAARVRDRFALDVATEVDRPQICDLPPGATRTLLPHHDGGHCSFLTAPAGDGPPRRRALTHDAFTTTNAHKVYQGLLLREAGDGLSLTSYFDLVHLLVDAWGHQRGAPAQLPALLTWYQGHVDAAIDRVAGRGYLAIGAQLGARGLARDAAIHHARATLELDGVPHAVDDLADAAARETLGVSFAELLARHAVLAPSETGDLLIGHNLFAWHGGVEGGRGRDILPMCVTATPTGPAYERWLAEHWARFFARATAAAA